MSLMCQKNSYLTEFHTKVKSCKPATISLPDNGKKSKLEGFNVVLEDTILFPEGGGQPDDRGTINDIPVLRVTRVGADAVNFVQTEIPAGTEVILKVDWTRRFDHMQQHTAQHLVTAIIDQKFGFPTTSWDMGTDAVMIELDTPTLSSDQMVQAEEEVNNKIRQNIAVRPELFENKDDPELLQCRAHGLPDDHEGPVRVLTIEGIDSTLCCGTHLSNLSHLQAVKFLGVEKGKKNKVNLSFLAGGRLQRFVGRSYSREKQLTGILKSPAERHPEQVDKTVKGFKNLQKTCNQQLREMATLEASLFKQSVPRDSVFVKHRKDGDNDYISVLMAELGDPNLPKLITVGEDKEGGMFVLAGSEQLVKDLGNKICEIFEGKGAPCKGVFRGKATKLTQRSQAEKLLRDYLHRPKSGDPNNES